MFLVDPSTFHKQRYRNLFQSLTNKALKWNGGEFWLEIVNESSMTLTLVETNFLFFVLVHFICTVNLSTHRSHDSIFEIKVF
jgi:hypothetical protein